VKSKLTKRLIRDAASLLRAGNYANVAAGVVGVSEDTWYRWLREAEETGAPALKREFADAVREATNEAEVKYVQIVEKAATSDWRAAAWWLERRGGDRWRLRQQHEHEHFHATEFGVLRIPPPLTVDEWQGLALEQQGVYAH